MAYHEQLAAAFKAVHGCIAEFLYTRPVKEISHGKTVWDSSVWVFKLTGHSKAHYGYAWSEPKDEGGGLDIITVLEIPPVDSPEMAVRVTLAARARKKLRSDFPER
jgi:hypothetical protein